MNYTLITGASGGIGKALAIKLAKKKHNLILVALNAEKLSKLSKNLQETYGGQATYIAADMTKQDALFQIFKKPKNKIGRSKCLSTMRGSALVASLQRCICNLNWI